MGKLTARKVEALKSPGHYVDGDGLALVIGKRGGKSWVLRTMVRGKRREIGLRVLARQGAGDTGGRSVVADRQASALEGGASREDADTRVAGHVA